RLIGKLLLKASNVLGNLLKKAGIAILNLVKNPIKNLAKRILGQAGTQAARSVGQFVAKKAAPAAAKVAGKAVGAAGKAVNVLKRFKFLSKLFKRVPFIGALIGIGIDLAMGERIDVAVAGAAGASLGAAIGGAIGTGLIPIPIVGTWVGAGVGSAVGDWAGKEIYKNFAGIQDAADKEAPVDQKYAAGRIGSTVAAARSQGRSGQNPQAPPSDSSTKLSAKTQENAEKNIFKDEKHLNVFSEIREKLKISSFVGELLQLGADMAIGEKVNKTRTDIAAQQIGSSIGRALSENELQVFGFNKKLIGPFSEELTKWAKGKIFKDLTSISFPSYDKAKEESSSSGGTTSDQPGQPGSGVEPGTAGGAIAASDLYKRIGANAEQWDIFRNSLALIESKGDYKVFGGSGKHYDGRYQMGEAAKKDGSKFAGVPFPGHSSDPNAPVRVSFRNNPELQETIFTGYTLANHNYLMGNPKYKSANIERKLQVLGYAHNQGMGGADNWLNTGVVGADGFGTKGTKYTDLIAANFRAKKSGGNLQLAQGAVAVPSTSHGSSPPGGGGSGSLGLSNPTPNSSPGVRGSSGYASDSGLDILGKTGDKIVAPASGTLQYAETGHTSWKDDSNPGKSGYQPQHSFLIELSKPFKYEGKTIKYSYGTHLSSLSSSVQNKSGIQIKAGEPIGAMGVANKVPHLHLGLLQNRAQSSESDWLSNVQVKNALLSNKGGGRGNGGPVKKHKASEFILGGGRTLTS
ncbi:MAG: M23 family metallopeptidase, partial [Candidatus Nanopelagicales bacterium]